MSSPTLTNLQHPVLTTQICLNAKYSTESPDFPPENVATGHRQGKAPCRHAHCCYSRLCHQMNRTFLTRKYHQLFFTYCSALSVSMETMAKSRDEKKGIICCAWLTEHWGDTSCPTEDWSTSLPAVLKLPLEAIPALWSWMVSGSIHPEDALEATIN